MDQSDFILMLLIVLNYAVVGLCLGSFASAIAHRITLGKSWIVDRDVSADAVKPARSFCPSCQHQLSVLDLIPLFSWLCLGGKCRYCHTKIPVRYPVLEVTGAMVMVMAYMVGAGPVTVFAFVITLPFFLTFFLLIPLKFKPPLYVYSLFFSHVFVMLYAVIWRNESL